MSPDPSSWGKIIGKCEHIENRNLLLNYSIPRIGLHTKKVANSVLGIFSISPFALLSKLGLAFYRKPVYLKFPND